MRDLDRLVALAARAFARRCGHEPTWASAAPGRVNLLGEHTDYNAGFVLPMAIDRWCVCVGAPANGSTSLLVAPDINESVEVSFADLVVRRHAAAVDLPAWAKYLAGAVVERLFGLGGEHSGIGVPEIDLLVVSTVPVGGGLSSSAAIETAGAVLIETALGCREVGEGEARLARALDCQRAEHRWAGVPCGLMDQLASSCGIANHALLIDCRDDTIQGVPLPPPDFATVLVVNSGVHHELAASEYAKRRATCETASHSLRVSSLREVASFETAACSRLDAEQARCVRHVVSENARTRTAAEALRASDLPTFGRLMLESHASLRDDYRVSCPELDTIVEIAAATLGVYGARMTGGGFGGCAVVIARSDAADHITQALPPAYHARTGTSCTIEQVRAVDGAGPCRLP